MYCLLCVVYCELFMFMFMFMVFFFFFLNVLFICGKSRKRKTAVVAADMTNNSDEPFLFRNWAYPVDRKPRCNGTANAWLWLAGRATSAASSYFPAVHLTYKGEHQHTTNNKQQTNLQSSEETQIKGYGQGRRGGLNHDCSRSNGLIRDGQRKRVPRIKQRFKQRNKRGDHKNPPKNISIGLPGRLERPASAHYTRTSSLPAHSQLCAPQRVFRTTVAITGWFD